MSAPSSSPASDRRRISRHPLAPEASPLLFFSMIAAFFAQLAVIYVPAFQWRFRTVPISIGEWLR